MQLTIGTAFLLAQVLWILQTPKTRTEMHETLVPQKRLLLQRWTTHAHTIQRFGICGLGWNLQIVLLLHSRCRNMNWSMTLSYTAGRMTAFCARVFNGHILWTESGHTQTLHWILQCAQFGEMVAWNTLPPKLSFNTCDRPAAQMEALDLASNLTKWVPTIMSSDGNVSWKNPHLHHHAYWQVVERRFSLLHP